MKKKIMRMILSFLLFFSMKNVYAKDFESGKKYKTKFVAVDFVIKQCGEILYGYLSGYIKNGRDINHLTPDNIFNSRYIGND